jgi:phosphopentomutase
MPGFDARPRGLWGAATAVSKGKDTPSGHWELAGVPVPWDWHYFPDTRPAFPQALMDEVARLAGTGGTLGNCHASGVPIIEEHCAEHLRTGWPICYTSADSVFQIAAHEEAFGLDRLLRLCRDIAPRLHAMRVGRVIAPPAPTLCDWVQGAGGKVHAIGKIGDIFSMHGIDDVRTGPDAALFDHLMAAAEGAGEGSLTFANFVEFDTLYGHRRDVSGYARALEWFDGRAGAFLACLRPGDLALFTADHGNDPNWTGTDHTRERVPVVGWGLGERPVGQVAFCDVGASVADHLGVASEGPGRSFL